MTTSVLLSRRHWTRYLPHTALDLDPEVLEWLQAIPNWSFRVFVNQPTEPTGNGKFSKLGAIDFFVEFETPDQALLFKLTWGGT